MAKGSPKKKSGLTASERALLGLLSMRAMSGYDMRQLIPQSIGHFWNESYGQIYPALKRMTVAGLVKKATERGKGKPDRNVYSLTEEGREELQEWLKAPVEMRTVARNELLLKVFFGAQVLPAAVREHVKVQQADAEVEQARYGEIARELKKSSANDPQLAYWLMTLSMGRHGAGAKIAWCRETLDELEKLEHRRKR